MALKCTHSLRFAYRREGIRKDYFPRGGISMDDRLDFLVYCIENYKNAMALKEEKR
jgi:hypothetical protein